MIVALALSLVLILSLARWALEPACPGCTSKHWAAHSTQLHCAHCGWNSGASPASAPAPSKATEPSQYEMCLG